MITVFGQSENYILLTDGVNGAIVDSDINLVDSVGSLSNLSAVLPWDEPASDVSEIVTELANAALTDLRVVAVTASARMYTIPKSVQKEAEKALKWRKEHKRGGTPVGMNTARTLAKGGQIGIKKIRHIAKYFPRHEVDKKAKGYEPGEDGFPSNGRIAWALWGGDAAWRWSSNIVERENKKESKTASGNVIDPYAEHSDQESYSINRYAKPEIDAFEIAQRYGEENAPDFVARVRLDGTGIDRLYMLDTDDQVYVWDDGSWDDLGHVDSDIYTYDRSLDDPYDTVDKSHIVIDPQTALIISAYLQERPFTPVCYSDINEEESNLIAAAIDEIDWVEIDAAIVAAGEEPLSGGKDDDGYTPEERSEKARRQVRDKSGKFAKMGGRVVVDGDASKAGAITRLNPDAGTVTVQMDDGSTEEVDAKRTEAESSFTAPPTQGIEPGEMPPQTPLDTSGILAKPRPPIDRPNAYLPDGLPPIRPGDFQKIIQKIT